MSKLVVFDVDGTFLNSLAVLEHALIEYSRRENLPNPDFEAVKNGYGSPHEHDFGWGVSKEDQAMRLYAAFDLMDELVVSGEPHLTPQLFHGAEEGFAQLKDIGHTLAIITSKEEAPFCHMMEYHNLYTLFSAHRTAGDIKSRGEKEKPAPDMLVSVMRELNFTPDETVMIGDSTMDMMMGRDAKTSTIGVTWGAHPKHRLVEAGAQLIVDTDFGDVVHAVKGVFEWR